MTDEHGQHGKETSLGLPLDHSLDHLFPSLKKYAYYSAFVIGDQTSVPDTFSLVNYWGANAKRKHEKSNYNIVNDGIYKHALRLSGDTLYHYHYVKDSNPPRVPYIKNCLLSGWMKLYHPITDDITLHALHPSGWPPAEVIIAFDGQNNKIRAGKKHTFSYDLSSLSLHKWHHFASYGSLEEQYCAFYIDGVKVWHKAEKPQATNNPRNFHIGKTTKHDDVAVDMCASLYGVKKNNLDETVQDLIRLQAPHGWVPPSLENRYTYFPCTDDFSSSHDLKRHGNAQLEFSGLGLHDGSLSNIEADPHAIYKQAARLTGKVGYRTNTTDKFAIYENGHWAFSGWFKLNKPLRHPVLLIGEGEHGDDFYGWAGATMIRLNPQHNKIEMEGMTASFDFNFQYVPLGTWNHVFAYTEDHGIRTLYVNGRKIGAQNHGSHGYWHRSYHGSFRALTSYGDGNDISVDLPSLYIGKIQDVSFTAQALYFHQKNNAPSGTLFGPVHFEPFRFLPSSSSIQKNSLLFYPLAGDSQCSNSAPSNKQFDALNWPPHSVHSATGNDDFKSLCLQPISSEKKFGKTTKKGLYHQSLVVDGESKAHQGYESSSAFHSLIFQKKQRVLSAWVLWTSSLPADGSGDITLLRLYSTKNGSEGDFRITLSPSKGSVFVQSNSAIHLTLESFPIQQFHHFVAVYDSDDSCIRMYINGTKLGKVSVDQGSWWSYASTPLQAEIAARGSSSSHKGPTFWIDLPLAFASSHVFTAADVQALYKQQAHHSSLSIGTQKNSISGFNPIYAAQVPLAASSYSDYVSIIPLTSSTEEVKLSADPGKGLKRDGNPKGNGATGTLKWKVPYVSPWFKSTHSAFHVWFMRQVVPTGSGSGHSLFSVKGPLLHVHFSTSLRKLIAGPPQDLPKKTNGVSIDAISSFPLHRWNLLYVYRDLSASILCLFVNGQFVGQIKMTDTDAQDTSPNQTVTLHTDNKHVLLQDFQMDSSPGPVHPITKSTSSNMWAHTWNQKNNHAKMNPVPILQDPAFPDTMTENNKFVFSNKLRMCAVFPKKLSNQLSPIKEEVNPHALHGPLGAEFSYSVGTPGDIGTSPVAGLYGEAFYTGHKGDGTLTIHPSSSSISADATLLSSPTWAVSGWFQIPSYSSDSSSGTLRLLRAVPPSGSNGDNSNGLCIELDYSQNRLHVLKQADNAAFVYLRHSLPAGTWFFLSVARKDTDDPTFIVRINGYPLQETITSKQTALPSWWSQHVPTFIVGDADHNDVPFCMDRWAWWTKDLGTHTWLTRSHSVIRQTAPLNWSPTKPDTGPPHQLLPSSVHHVWAASLLAQSPSASQKVTGETDIRMFNVEKIQSKETDKKPLAKSTGVQRDAPGMYKGSLRIQTGYKLTAVSSTVHNWVQNKAFVFSLWIKPNKTMQNPVEFFGLRQKDAGDQESGAPECRIHPNNQTVNILGDSAAITVDTLFSMPVSEWTHLVLHRVGTKTFRIYINQLRVGEVEASDLPDWWQKPGREVDTTVGRPGEKMDVSIDLPFWFRGDSSVSAAADAYGNTDLVEHHSDNWGDSLIKRLYLRQLQAAKNQGNPYVSETRPLSKVVLGTDKASRHARKAIGLLTVFPYYSGPNAPSPSGMQTGGCYGPHAGTYGYKGVGSDVQVKDGKGVFQSAMHVSGQNAHHYLSIKPGINTSKGANNQNVDNAMRNMMGDGNKSSTPSPKAISLWLKIPSWSNNTFTAAKIVSQGASESNPSSEENNMQLFIDKSNNVVQLFPDDPENAEKVNLQVYDTFQTNWTHIHIVRTQTKRFEVYINGYHFHAFEPSKIPSWWGSKLPEIRLGTGNQSVLFDFFIWHHTAPTNDQLQTILSQSSPSGWTKQDNSPVKLTPSSLLPNFLDASNQYASYLLDATSDPNNQPVNGSHSGMPVLTASHPSSTIADKTPASDDGIKAVTNDVVYKGALAFQKGGSYLTASHVPIHGLLGNPTFVIQLWVKPLTAWKDSSNVEIFNVSDDKSSVCLELDPANNEVIFARHHHDDTKYTVPAYIEHSVPKGKWSSVILSRDSKTQFSVYINGFRVDSTSIPDENSPSVFSNRSQTPLTLSLGCLQAKAGTRIQLDLLMFFRPVSGQSKWSTAQIQKLYSVPKNQSKSSSLAHETPLPYPLLPGKAVPFWKSKVPQLMYVFLRYGNARCFGRTCDFQSSITSYASGVKVLSQGGVYQGALQLKGPSSKGAVVYRSHHHPPRGFPHPMKKWLGRSEFAMTAWVRAEKWPSYPVVLMEVRYGAQPSENGKLQLTVDAKNDTLAVSDIQGATAKNQNIKNILSPGNWHHVAVVREEKTKFTVYIDAKAQHTFHFSASDSLPMWWGHARVQLRFLRTIGAAAPDSTNGNVHLDRMTFWLHKFSSSELETLIQATAPHGYESLQQRSKALDNSRKRNHDTAFRTPMRTEIPPPPNSIRYCNPRKQRHKGKTSQDGSSVTKVLSLLIFVTVAAVVFAALIYSTISSRTSLPSSPSCSSSFKKGLHARRV